MFVEAFEQGAAKRNKNQGNDYDGENGVRSQQDEINGADPALSMKWNVANAVVVQQIGKQENRGNRKRRNHEALVNLYFTVANGGVAAREEHAAGTV